MSKTIRVQTNDVKQQNVNLKISGEVEKFVTIEPSRVKFTGTIGESLKSQVKIIPEKKYPFKIIEVKAKKGDDIQFNLKEVKTADQSAYELTVENVKQDKGRYFDSIILKTDSTIQPEITIKVYGHIHEKHQPEEENVTPQESDTKGS